MPDRTADIPITAYDGGVVAIDSGMLRPGMAACYLLEGDGEVAVIETGNAGSVSRILETLTLRGWGPEQVRHVIVTHVHLDHAGGAGRLIAALPNANLCVHPRGARHMVDPSKLESSARAVYGDEAFDAMYGALVPVPAARVLALEDGSSIEVGGRALRIAETPGHARHHFCIWDRQTRGWFSGDTFGVSYRDLDTAQGAFIFPTTTPIQFDPPALVESIGRRMAESPECMYLTHYGRVTDVARLADDMTAGVAFFADLGRRYRDSSRRTADIVAGMLEWLAARCRRHGVTLPDDELTGLLLPDVELNTQGIEFWLDRSDSA